MKNSQNSWLRASTIIALVVGVFVTLNAMKEAAPQQAEPELFVWYYVEGEATEASSYRLSQEGLPACGNYADVICSILAPEDEQGRPNMHAPIGPSTVILQIEKALESIRNGQPTTNQTVLAFRIE